MKYKRVLLSKDMFRDYHKIGITTTGNGMYIFRIFFLNKCPKTLLCSLVHL